MSLAQTERLLRKYKGTSFIIECSITHLLFFVEFVDMGTEVEKVTLAGQVLSVFKASKVLDKYAKSCHSLIRILILFIR